MSDVREVFDRWAREGRAEGMEHGHGPAARMAFERLKLRPGSRYLDIGCGNGYTVRWAALESPQGRAVGLDLSSAMIELAWRMSADLPNVSFLTGSFPDVHLRDAPFDAIFSMEAFYYLEDLDASLRRVHELLRPGGQFACVVDYYGENKASHSWPEDVGVSMTLLGSDGWADSFRRAGLGVVDQCRLRLKPDQASAEWKVSEGSLLTLGRR